MRHMKITNKIISLSYILFALSLMILGLNKVAAIVILAVSVGAFLIGGLLRARNYSPNQHRKNKK